MGACVSLALTFTTPMSSAALACEHIR
jgi:hypothetical protein